MNHLPSPSWFDELTQANPDVCDVARILGLHTTRSRIGPCPACGKDDRRHPPIMSAARGAGWKCWGCGVGGNVAQLMALVLVGDRAPGPDGWQQVRAFAAQQGWCSAPRERGVAAPRFVPPPAVQREELPYPERDQLLHLLQSCRPVRLDRAAARWCLARGFRPRRDQPLPAAILPDVYPWPEFWPRSFRPFRLVVPMCDAAGLIRGMHGRVPSTETPTGKTRWPAGRRCSRLLFASPAGRAFLRGGPAPARILLVEGMTSFLSASSHADPDTLVLGADNGGFPAFGDSRVRDFDGPVFAAPDCHDPDGTGDRYWREIKRGVPRAVRLDLPGRLDVADLLNGRCSFQDLLTMRG